MLVFFKNIRRKFYLIVGFLILLFCVGYAELALFVEKLNTSSEAGQISAVINKDIKELEREFWKLRFWEKVVDTEDHPDAEKQFGLAIEEIKKRLLELDPRLFTPELSERTLHIFRLIIEYKNTFDKLVQCETDRRLNQTQIESNYQVMDSAILMKNETDYYKTLRNLDRFLRLYLQTREDAEYQAFRIVFEVLKEKLVKSGLMDDRVSSYITNLDSSTVRDFALEKETRKIRKHLDDISAKLMILFSDISQSVEKLSDDAISTGERFQNTLHRWFLISAAIAFVLLLLIIHLIARTIVNPIRKMSEVVAEVKSGNDQARFFSKSRDEVAELGFAFNDMLDTINQHHYHLEEQVEKRTSELNKTLEKVEEANRKIMDSLQYAKMIQRSMLTNMDMVKLYIPRSFFIWMPRDIVGGDIFFTDSFEDGFVVAVLDCTGHGVPGAFMTMIAFSGLTRIIRNEGCHDPAQILKHLNYTVKTSLQQDTDYAVSDDGLDAAICVVSHSENADEKVLTFAGARLPLFYSYGREIIQIKGDRQSLGYKRSDLDFDFTNHVIPIEEGMSFYMLTDGFTDQLGGKNGRRFGTGHLKRLIEKNSEEPIEKQGEILLQTFEEHRGEHERQDDVTVVGFTFIDQIE